MDDRHRAISILSLDRCRPFFGRLGLNVDPGGIQGELRVWTQALLEEKPLPSAGDVIAHVSAKRGTIPGQALANAIEAFDLSNDQHFNLWTFRLIVWCRDDKRWNSLALPDRASHPLRAACFEALDTDAEDLELERSSDAPLTDWDLYVYAAYRYDDDMNDPFNDLVLAITRYRLVRFWSALGAELNEAETAAFLRAAQAVASSEGEARNVAPLPYVLT